jgi:hypothetical protein
MLIAIKIKGRNDLYFQFYCFVEYFEEVIFHLLQICRSIIFSAYNDEIEDEITQREEKEISYILLMEK